MSKRVSSVTVAAAALCLAGTGARAEGIFAPSRSLDVQRHAGLTLADADKMVTTLRERDRRIIDIEVRPTRTCDPTEADLTAKTCSTSPLFDFVSEPNDGRRWLVTLAQSEAQYAASWKENSGAGMRIVDIEPHSVYTYTRSGPRPSRVQFSAVWIEDRQKTGWASYSQLSSQAFSEKFKLHGEGQDMAVTDYEVYELDGSDCPKPTPSDPPKCIAAIFTKPPAAEKWAFVRNMTPASYIDKKEAYEKGGFRTLLINNQWGRIAATFIKQPLAENWQSYARMTEPEYKKTAADMRNKGWRLVDFEAGSLDLPNSKDISYGSIWYKPSPPPRRATPGQP